MNAERASDADHGRGSIDHLRRLFEWNARANAAAVETARAAGATSGGALEGLAHLLAAERNWLGRVRGEPDSVPLWPGWDLAQCREVAESVAADWRGVLEPMGMGDLGRRVSYVNSEGARCIHAVEAILLRVIAHSSHHRSEVALELRRERAGAQDRDDLPASRNGPIE